MNIRRFVAPDMREAAAIRAELRRGRSHAVDA
jgi:hypothetical protein